MGSSVARRTRRGRRLGLLLTLALVAGGIYAAAAFVQTSETLVSERCTATGAAGAGLSAAQAGNAALITAVAVRRGLPARAASIGLATAMQESKLQNIDYGDQAGPDSRGLFQQRPSQGWGTEAQVMDRHYASNAFFTALAGVRGYEGLPITVAAQRVQRSAFPDAYAKHEVMARGFASALTGHTPAGLDCTLRSPEAAGDPAAVRAGLAADFGEVAADTDGRSVVVAADGPRAWSVAQWAVANAKALSIVEVTVDGRTWDRAARSGWQAADTAPGQVRITVAAPPAR